MYLTDLCQLEEVYGKNTDNELINYEKFRRVASIIQVLSVSCMLLRLRSSHCA